MLLNYSEKIIHMVNEMKKAIKDPDIPSGILEIGTVETVIKLPSLLSNYHRNYPNVDLSLISGVTKELIDQLLKRKLDGAFVTGFESHPTIDKVDVFQEHLVLICSNEQTSYDEVKQK